MSGWGWGVTHRRGAFWSPRIIALRPRLSMRELIPCSSQATQGFSSRSVMYSWTQSSLGSAQTCRPLLVLKLWREAEGLHTGECNVGGSWAPRDPSLLLPWTSWGLSTCSNHVPFTLGFTDLPGSPMGVPSESQHCCLPNEREDSFLLSPLPSPPSAQGQTPGTLCRPQTR